MRDFGRLLRLSLSASALADVAAGIVFGAGVWPGGFGPWLLCAASLCVYHGGMALNDWADRDVDARTRPERPIPAGAIPATSALAIALVLLALGPALASLAHPSLAWPLAGIALGAAVYDLLGRGPWLGPTLLAACRAANLASGIWFGRLAIGIEALEPRLLAGAPLLYGAYVFVVSRLGRLEDGQDGARLGRRPARLLAGLGAILVVLPLVPPPQLPPSPGDASWLVAWRIPLATLVVAAGSLGLLRRAFRPGPWSRPAVLVAMGMALRRLLVFTAGAAFLRGTPTGLVVGVAILLGFPLSHALRRSFPPS